MTADSYQTFQGKIAELQKLENEQHAAVQEVCARLADIDSRLHDPAQPTPSANEMRAARDDLIAADLLFHGTQDEIRRLRWAADGIVEGPPLPLKAFREEHS